MRTINFKLIAGVLAAFIFCLIANCDGQNTTTFEPPHGGTIKKVIPRSNGQIIVVTEYAFYILLPTSLSGYKDEGGDYFGEEGVVNVVEKSGLIFVLLGTGDVLVYYPGNHKKGGHISPGPGSDSVFKTIVGDDLYALTNNVVFVSRDSGAKWNTDTVGLNSSIPNAICLDVNQNVYLATSKGLFKQTPKGTKWSKLISYTDPAASDVFIDSKKRIFVADYGAFFESTDGGNTFSSFNGGNMGFYGLNINSIGGDNMGNIYLNTGSGLWRSDSGTKTFIEIDSPISSLVTGFANQNIYNFIGGDSILYAATNVGFFASRDLGKTWVNGVAKIKSEQNYSLVKANNGNFVVSTGLGVFYRTAKNDSVWTQTFPSTGYVSGVPVFEDKNGVIYTYGAPANLNSTNAPKLVVKSTDNGVTWNPDTAGISVIGMDRWFVDENGTQYAASAYTGPVTLFVKTAGGSWQPDNNGFATTTSEQITTCWGSDGNGTIYVGTYSGQGRVLWKKTGTGAWGLDTLGLKGTQVFAIAREHNGTILAATANGLYQNSGSGWKQTKDPNGKGDQCFTVSVDASGTVWASFAYYNGSYNAIGDGVYFSTDNCSSWKGINTGAATFRQVVPVGAEDTAYGVSYYDGIYTLTKKGTNAVQMVSNPESNNHLKVYPSPAFDYLQVELDKGKNTARTGKLEVIDLKGKKLSETSISGSHQTIDIHNLAAGVYVVNYNSGDINLTQRFVKAK